MSDTTTMTGPVIPQEVLDEARTLDFAARVNEVDCDLPGFRRFAIHGPDGRTHYRLALTVPAGGKTVDLDADELGDVMWALATSTRRDRRHARDGGDPVRADRFRRKVALLEHLGGDAPAPAPKRRLLRPFRG